MQGGLEGYFISGLKVGLLRGALVLIGCPTCPITGIKANSTEISSPYCSGTTAGLRIYHQM